MNNLPPDLQRKTALELSPLNLINLCLTNKIFNKNICNSNDFWLEKLKIDYPSEFLPVYEKGEKLENPKSLYIKRFNQISNKIEEYIPIIIEKVYGKDFLEYLTPIYKKKLYENLYNIYLVLKEKGGYDIDEEDGEKEDLINEIYDLFPTLIRLNEDEPDGSLRELYMELSFIDIINKTNLTQLNRIKSGKI